MTTLTAGTDDLIYEIEDGIATLTLNRPQARNAFTFAMYDGVQKLCEEMPTDGSVRVLIITGAGEKAFAAGTDMSQFHAFDKAQDALDYEKRVGRVAEAVEKCPVPTIAAIAGACTGGGAGIASCCDIRIATEGLKFGFPIARTLGNTLSMENFARVKDLIGVAKAKEIIFTSRLVGAQEALAAGLVSEVLPDHAALMARAKELAVHIAGHAPLTLRACKEAFRRLRIDGPHAEGDDLVVMTFMSEDFREGLDAFFNKRKPEFKGK
ncbi:enoyl-CoA hydratase/isomerase family protein [Acuticoccus sp. I52.16.1]|uniref:enoyl-CoA hydratase/isomerase family protein n=1 Tax=Acuticoccus sp. I52.16.1 TaxID=2928472 RepID=UPI001FD61C8F|nr:enoyl-CoA hydratase/isomerase family protein [Acuticoccus sp. I52.16.1]UOM33772.1 enoyl-CoA hydratase/isomerase family protein [Acuticoccus sp. I52.16.1]